MVTVRLDDLKEYLTDYHERNRNDRCKADHQEWPCDVYQRLSEVVSSAERDFWWQ